MMQRVLSLLQHLRHNWPLAVALAFTVYSALLLIHATASWQRMRQDANAWLVADQARRTQSLGDLAAEWRTIAVGHAELNEIRNYLVNRDLGMSPRYGLNASLAIIEVRFEQLGKQLADRWNIAAPHIVLYAESGEKLAESLPASGLDAPAPPLPDGPWQLRIDTGRGRIETIVPVMHKGRRDGMVVISGSIDIFYRNLLPTGSASGYRELLLTQDGKRLPGRDADIPFDAAQLSLLAGLADNVVMPVAAIFGDKTASPLLSDSLLIKTSVPNIPLLLVTFLPEKIAYGHLVSRYVLVGASALLLVMLLGSIKLEQMRRRAEQLEADVAAAERERAITEFRNVELSAEIRRRELAEQERNGAEARIMDRNAQLDAIFSLSPDAFVSFDALRRVKYANPAFMQMTGYNEAEIIGLDEEAFSARLVRDCLPTSPFAGVTAMRQTKLKDAAADPSLPREARPRLLIELAAADNRVLELKLRLADTQTVSQILYLRDVTHEAEVDRMKSEFLSHAAHELRTPMASIYGFSELLMTQEFDPETRRDLISTIHTQTEWLVEIINELLDLARIESRRGKDFRIEAVPLTPLVHELVAAMSIDPERWPLTIDGGDGLPPARADAAKLRQTLTNVLGNAVKFSPRGGAIEIRGLTRTLSGQAEVGIAVTDHGIGMTPEQVARVGERFFRADTSGNIPGTGLGMSIVREILQLLGGSLGITSTAGSGTTVTLWLPAMTIPEDAPSPAHRAPEPNNGQDIVRG